MLADVMTSKTEALGWKPKRKLNDYIEMLRTNRWESI
jgi:UDP-glucose 4-epimerase